MEKINGHNFSWESIKQCGDFEFLKNESVSVEEASAENVADFQEAMGDNKFHAPTDKRLAGQESSTSACEYNLYIINKNEKDIQNREFSQSAKVEKGMSMEVDYMLNDDAELSLAKGIAEENNGRKAEEEVDKFIGVGENGLFKVTLNSR